MDGCRDPANGYLGCRYSPHTPVPDKSPISGLHGAPKHWACSMLTISPIGNLPRHVAYAKPRFITSWPSKAACFGELFGWERANWFCQTRTDGCARQPSMNIAGGDRTGLSTPVMNIWQCERKSACLTCPPLAR